MGHSMGTRLGPYRILAPLGAGGMGEVYEAHDPRLGRRVALKVLRPEVAADPDRLARFEREAKAVAALSHPNILTVHDVGSEDGTPFVVTEFLDGETLREVVSHRSPTQRQVLGWGVAIAQGLSAAHQKGLVHRDIKPENLFLTTDGRIKILDFGLAKQTAPGPIESEAMTASGPSEAGVVMGTVAYMSPEQAQGRPVDARTDLFSLGVVLYELLAKRHPFRKETAGATLGAILSEAPPSLSELDPSIPRGIDGIVRRCLEKEREGRFQTAHDLGLALEAVLAAPAGAAVLEDVEERSPYPGLSSFTEQDADHFFGREEEVRALWEKLRTRRLLAVIGPSGAGKTSFVRAGVVPARREGWRAIVCTPGRAPLRSLGQALGPELAGDPEALRKLAVFDDPETAFELLARWRRGHAEALVVVDQFEELFTQNGPEIQRTFAELLGLITREADVHLVLSMRDDFLMRCHDQPALFPVFDALTPLGPITGEGLRRALVEPARKRGFRFEDGDLVGQMVRSVEGERAALPLLAFAVSRLWEKRDRGRKLLAREAYEELGGVAGALAQHAEATLDGIGSDRQGLVREIFRNLVTAEGTRAACDREELLSAFPDRAAAEEVLRQLVGARLLTSYEVETKEGEPGCHRVEIVHESLLLAWPRLVRWQKQDEEGALLRDQLRKAAHLWDEKGRTGDLLWTGAAYREFDLWKERYPGALTALEDSFAKAMADKSRRRRRLIRTAVASVIAALAGVAIAVDVSRQLAVAQMRRAEAAQALALGRLNLAENPNAALAYAIASLERADNVAARGFAVEALWQGPPALYLPDPVVPLYARWSRDGRRLAVGGGKGLALIDSEGATRRGLLDKWENPLGFSSDGRRLVSKAVGGAGTVFHVWAIPSGRLERTLEYADNLNAFLVNDELLTQAFDPGGPKGEGPALVRRISLDGTTRQVLGRWEPHGLFDYDIDPNGTWLVSQQRGRILQQRLDALSAPARLLGTLGEDSVAWLYPWRNRAVTGDSKGDIGIWDLPSGRLERTLKSPGRAQNFALDPEGRRLAAGPHGAPRRSLVLFDLAAPRSAEPVPLLNSEVNWVNRMEFSPDGSWLATMSRTAPITFWNVGATRAIVLGRQKPPHVAVNFTRDGHLVSTSDEGVVRLWPLSGAGDEGVCILWSRPGARIGGDLALDPVGRFAVIGERMAGKIHLLPLDGAPPSAHELKGGAAKHAAWTALDPEGRSVAVWYGEFGNPAAASIRVLDLSSGAERVLDSQARGEGGCEGKGGVYEGVEPLVWLPDGRLASDGEAGLRLWDLAAGTSNQLRPCRKMATEGSWLLATPDSRAVLRLDPADPMVGMSSLSMFDLVSSATREITSHGGRLLTFALDGSGTTLVTGSIDGVVRAGPLTGEEPHLLFGHAGPVTSVAVSPDGRWIASGSDDGTIRVWPMPDMTKPPLHTWPLDQLLAKLKSLTNLRAFRYAASDTGWRIEVGPFPGWKVVPTWEP
jgi:WD40 repeat protein